MINNKYLKVTLGIIATILLGAIGSGVWEYLLKPSFGTISELTLNIITFGIESFKNDLYSEIAIGFYEKSSWNNLMLLNSIYLMVGTYIIVYLYGKTYKDNEIENIQENLSNVSDEEKKIMIKELLIINTKKLKKAFYIVVLSIGTLIIINQFTVYRLGYINNSIANYQQLKRIVIPYINNKELNLIESQFALIKNKKSYEVIILKLEKILERNNIQN